MLMSAPLASANRAIAGTLRRDRAGPVDDLEQRPVGGDQAVGRHDDRGDHGDEEVDEPASSSPPNSARGKPRAGSGLLGHVDGVLEADQREEREPRAAEDRERHRLALLELERPGRRRRRRRAGAPRR